MSELKPHKPVLETLQRYLMLWDPIGVTNDMANEGQALNEYDSYAGVLYTVLSGGATEAEVQLYLQSALDHMGEPYDSARDQQWAKNIHTYFNHNSGYRK